MSLAALKTALLGSKLKIAGVVLIGFVGTIGLAAGLGVIGVPGIADVNNQFGEVDESTTEINTDLIIDNPNPVGISFGDAAVAYTVSMNDVELAEGDREGVEVGTGTTTVDLTTQMDNQAIPAWWSGHIERGERSQMVVDADITHDRFSRTASYQYDRPVETDLIGEFDSEEPQPVSPDDDSALGLLTGVSDPLFYINETSGEWGDVTDEETPMEIDFVAYNPQPVPLTVTQLEYEISMNDVEVGTGATEREYVIAPDGEETVETVTVIDNDSLDEWWVTHLQNEQTTELEMQFWLTVEVGGETFRIPIEALDHEETIETDIFGNEE